MWQIPSEKRLRETFISLNLVILKKGVNIFLDILTICSFCVLAEATMENQIKQGCEEQD